MLLTSARRAEASSCSPESGRWCCAFAISRANSRIPNPDSFRSTNKRRGIRELVEAPYRVVYRVGRETVEIVDVFHSAQLPPWER